MSPREKVSALLFLLVYATIATKAQTGKVKFGIQGGVNIATLTSFVVTPRNSIYIGGLANYQLKKKLFLKGEVYLSGQGAVALSNSSFEKIFNLTYIDVPVSIQYKLLKSISIETGAQLGLLTNAVKSNGGVSEKLWTNFDLSWVLGGSYYFGKGIGLNMRYNVGLSQISNLIPDVFNRVLQFGVLYLFERKASKPISK